MTINLLKNNNRLLLVSTVELVLQAYQNQIAVDYFVFKNPLNGQITKIHHKMHAKDRETRQLVHEYSKIRQTLLDNTRWSFNSHNSTLLSVAIENYLSTLADLLDDKSVSQLKRLDEEL